MDGNTGAGDGTIDAGEGTIRTRDGNATAPQRTTMLGLATFGFAVSFWAWALLAPMGATIREELSLTAFQQSLVVAIPVLVGSVGRIPVGALTDRLGARRMFPAVVALSIVPVLYLGHVADSFTEVLVGGFFLGLAGTTFAIGVPFVNAWYPPERRGLALGIFGMGTGGTAIAAFTTVQLAEAVGRSFPFDLVAAVMAVYAATAYVLLRDRTGRAVTSGRLLARMASTLRLPVTWQLALLYAVAFGGFVAFSVYLPTYLVTAYDLTRSDAGLRTAGFVVLAVALRPVGGWLSDRVGAVPVLVAAYAVIAVLASVAAAELPLIPLGTLAFLGMAAALGAGSGAVFALVAQIVPPERVGAVTGMVGAAGGLGGFFPPLVMGGVFGVVGDYSLGYVLLALAAALTCAFTATAVRRSWRAAVA